MEATENSKQIQPLAVPLERPVRPLPGGLRLTVTERCELYDWRDACVAEAVARAEAEAAKSERRAIVFGDIVGSQVIAMRAAVVAAKLEGLDVGMQWIANTLCGPGHLPDLDEAKALGGAQALWDKETAEAEAFRAAHPAPGA